MSNVALQMEHVYKKFRKGEIFNSLRDLIPALTGRMFRQQELSGSDQREFWALQDISFEVKEGEAFGIIGHNGAGKSTMLKLLSRIMKPSRGTFQVKGRVSALIELAAGFHQDLTGRENIYLYGTILGMTRGEIAAKFDDIVEFSGLEQFIDTPVKRYSSGMYARLGFAVACHVNPDVLLVDEVLSVGDYVFQRKCVSRMKEVIRNGATVLFVSHNLRTVSEFCQRGILLDHGRVVKIGAIEDVISAYLNRSNLSQLRDVNQKQAIITAVRFRDERGECTRFQSGDKVWIDIEVTGQSRCKKLAVQLYLKNEEQQVIFNTSTERLGLGNFDLEAGSVYTCTFELNLNVTPGMYHPCVGLFRYDTEKNYDRWEPAATIYVSYHEDVRGGVNCFPKVTRQEVRPPLEKNLTDLVSEGRSGGKLEVK